MLRKRLKCWSTPENGTGDAMNEAPAMSLPTTPALSSHLKEFLIKHISSELSMIISHDKLKPQDSNKQKGKFQHLEWMFVPPTNPSDIKTVNGKDYHWCLKCNQRKGQWVMKLDTSSLCCNMMSLDLVPLLPVFFFCKCGWGLHHFRFRLSCQISNVHGQTKACKVFFSSLAAFLSSFHVLNRNMLLSMYMACLN